MACDLLRMLVPPSMQSMPLQRVSTLSVLKAAKAGGTQAPSPHPSSFLQVQQPAQRCLEIISSCSCSRRHLRGKSFIIHAAARGCGSCGRHLRRQGLGHVALLRRAGSHPKSKPQVRCNLTLHRLSGWAHVFCAQLKLAPLPFTSKLC